LSKKHKKPNKNNKITSTQNSNPNNLKLSYKEDDRMELIHKINSMTFKTETQKELYKKIKDNSISFVSGPAGTGKTFISLWVSLNLLFNSGDFKKLYITKPYQTAGEDFGFLPGGISEKYDPLLASYYWNLEKILGYETYKRLISHRLIEITPLAYMRGITFENCIVLVDEAQNTSPEQLELLLTRLGENSKIIVMGDEKQSDINKKSGLSDAAVRFQDVEDIAVVKFSKEDVVRHPLVKKIVELYDD
jgi:phosphate starvation-inducible protein PhoH and related proteins